MKPLSDFYSRLIPFVPGCPEPMANQAIVDAAIAFCEDSLVLREDLTSFNTAVGDTTYVLAAPSASYSIARVLQVAVNGWPIEVVPYERMGALLDMSGTPSLCYVTRSGASAVLNLYPTPDEALSVRVNAALRPSRAATELDDDLLDLWVDGVVTGAMSRIMAVPNQPFSDPQAAAMYMARSIHASNKARVEGSYGKVRGQMKVTQRPFA